MAGEPIDESQCATYLKALADPTRLRVIKALRPGAESVSNLAKTLDADLAVVSHHLRVLFHAGIVVTQRQGKYIFYSLNREITGQLARGKALDFGCCKLELTDD